MAKIYEDRSKYLDSRLQFQNLSKNANAIIREFGVSLNYRGFVEVMTSYMRTDDLTSISELEELLKSFTFWIEYLGDIKTIISYYKNHFEIQSECTSEENKNIDYKNKFFILKQYEKSLQKQETLFNKAYKDLMFQYSDKIKKYMRVTED